MKNLETHIRNGFHVLIGFTIGYIFFFVTGICEYPINTEYWNNALSPLLGFVVAGSIGFLWERRQELKYNIKFDPKDILRTGFGGVLGGIFSFIFVSKILMLLLLVISAILVVRDFAKTKKQ